MSQLPREIDHQLIAELKQGLPDRVRKRLQDATDRIIEAKRNFG